MNLNCLTDFIFFFSILIPKDNPYSSCIISNFDISYKTSISSVSVKFNLPIEAYDFKEVEVSLELQNTLPLQVEITNLQLLSGEKQDVDENLVATPADLIIKGGSLDNPGETPITLNIKALEGTIPNITGVKMGLAIKSAPGFADTLLSLKQGVSIKSATATLRGGVTLGVANE